jgi:methyl-accepting chemotaxis protein WspA
MFKGQSLITRILLGFSLPIIFLVGLSTAVTLNVKNSLEIEETIDVSEDTLDEVNYLLYEIVQIMFTTQGYVLDPKNAADRKSYEEEIGNFQSHLEILNNLDPSESAFDRRRYYINQLILISEKFIETSQDILKLVEGNKINEAEELIRELDLKELDEIRENFLVEHERIFVKNKKDFQDLQRSLIWIVGLGSAISIPFSILVAVLISLTLKNKMTQVVVAAEKISEGDLTQTLESQSEIKELGQLMTSFKNMTDRLNSLIAQVQNSGIQVTTSSTEIAASGKQLEATAAEQVASTNEVVATAKEIAANSEELSQTMDDVAKMANQTADGASNGQANLLKMEKTMRQLAAATTSISTKLGAISEKANSINTVVTTITQVADRTNLLSLNAAIEAEKAGEYGAGFAVVAREIRRLADQTAVASLDIEQMVKDMQGAVSTGVMEMDKFTKEVSLSVNDVQKISHQLGEIIKQVQSLTPRFQIVSQGMESQTQAAGQITEAMIQLSEAGSQIADSLRETNRGIQQLNDAAQGLQREISRFKIRG